MVSILRPSKKRMKQKQEQGVVKGLLPTVEPTVKFGYINEPIPETAEVIEKYWIKEPFSGVVIAKLPESGGSLEYFVQEITLTEKEQSILDKIIEIVSVEINPSALEKQEDIKVALLEEAKRIMKKYVKKFPILLDQHVRDKINYYLERDLLGYGPIHTLMNDWRIEDISCDGVNSNIYIWHRRYESVPTSIKFTDRKALDDFIVKLAHKSGKHVSSAFPIVDAMIFGKHRLAASFREEISPKGSTFTIRKFREEPYSIIDLMNLNTVSDAIAAYLWLMMENRASILVIGGTAAGKTTILNAIAGLIKPGYKVVTVEETAEINIPTENWVQFTSRESYGLTGNKVGEVSLFDLVRTSLRYRPDFLIVGEVRGEEAFVLFQAVASVTGDTPIMIREKGKVKLVKIGELVDRYYSRGEERIAKFVKGIEVLTVAKNNEVTFRPISYVLRHTAKEIYNIRYEGGSVRATGNHSVFVFDDDGSIVEKPVSALSASDFLVSFCGSDIKSNATDDERLLVSADTAGKSHISYAANHADNESESSLSLSNVYLKGKNNDIAKTSSSLIEFDVKTASSVAKLGSRITKHNYAVYRSDNGEVINAISWVARLNGKTSFISSKDKGYSSVYVWDAPYNPMQFVPSSPFRKLRELLSPVKMPDKLSHILDSQQALIPKQVASEAIEWIINNRGKEIGYEAKKIIDNLRALLNSNLIVSRIRSISRQEYHGYVYDVSVPNSEAFFGGETPVLLHNTGHGGLCLPPWETVVAMVNGTQRITPIGELYKQIKQKSTVLISKTHEIIAPTEKVEVATFDAEGNSITTARIGGISSRDYKGKLFRFRTRGGNEATVTEDHPMIVLRGSTLQKVPAKHVRLDDMLLVAKTLPKGISNNIKSLNLIDEFKRANLLNRLVVSNIQELLAMPSKNLRLQHHMLDCYRSKDFIPLEKYIMLHDTHAERRMLRLFRSGDMVPVSIPVNREFCRLIGFYLAKGNASAKGIEFSFNSNESDMSTEIKNAIENIFNIKPKLIQKGNRSKVVVSNNLIKILFANVLKCGYNANSKRVPDIVFNLPEELAKEVADAYLLGNSSAYRRADGEFFVSSTVSSRELASGIYYLMLKLGYNMLLSSDERSVRLSVAKGEDARRFLAEFSIGKKIGYYEKHIDSLESTQNKMIYSGSLVASMQNVNISQAIMNMHGSVAYEEIVEIEPIEYSGKVYDFINVKNTHNFVQGFGIISSNCTIHGESLDTAVKRLTSPPMNVAESYIPLMNVALMLERVVLPKTVAGVPFGRRVTNVWEIEDFAKYVSVFEWSPTEDIFYDYTRRSVMLHRFAYRTGRSFTDMLDEIERRKMLLKYLQANNIRQVKEVYKYITEYYVDRDALFRRLGIKVETIAQQPPAEVHTEVSAQQAAEEAQPPLPPQPIPEIAKTSLPTDPIKMLQSGSFQILSALFEAKGPVEEEVLMKSVGLERAEFESLLSMLVKVGHAVQEKRGEGQDQKSYVSITADGTRAYSLISKNVGGDSGKRGKGSPKRP